MAKRSRVFTSYARGGGEARFERLHRDLEVAGIDVWWDRDKMAGRGGRQSGPRHQRPREAPLLALCAERPHEKPLDELVAIIRQPVPHLGSYDGTPALRPHFLPWQG